MLFVPLEKLFALRDAADVPPRPAHRPHPHPREQRAHHDRGDRARGRGGDPVRLAPPHGPRRRPARRGRRSRSRRRSSPWPTTGATGSRTRCRSSGASTRCTTASSRWTGWRRAACTRSTRRSRRRSPCSRSCCSATARACSVASRCSSPCSRCSSTPTCACASPGCAGSINTPGVAPLAPRDRRRGARQELRPSGRRQALRHRVPAEGGAAGRVRHPLAGPRRRLPAPSRVPVHRRGEGRRGCVGYGAMRILDLDQRATPESAVEAHVALPESRPTHRAFVRLNMISSVDGGTAVGGVSGGLGNRDDHAVFAALRAQADGCIVGLGTVIAEHYNVPVATAAPALRRVRHQRRQWRGGAASRRDAPRWWCRRASVPSPTASPSCAPATASSSTSRRSSPRWPGKVLVAEGGPTLAGLLAAQGLLDEFFVTIAPRVIAGSSARDRARPRRRRVALGARARLPRRRRLPLPPLLPLPLAHRSLRGVRPWVRGGGRGNARR